MSQLGMFLVMADFAGKNPSGLRTPMNNRMAMPPDGRSCSNVEDTESEPMVRPRPVGTSDNTDVTTDPAVPTQPAVGSSTAYYLAQRQLEIMKVNLLTFMDQDMNSNK